MFKISYLLLTQGDDIIVVKGLLSGIADIF